MELVIFLLNNIAWFVFFYLFSKEKIPYEELPKLKIKNPFKKKEKEPELQDISTVSLKEIFKKKK